MRYTFALSLAKMNKDEWGRYYGLPKQQCPSLPMEHNSPPSIQPGSSCFSVLQQA